MGDNQEEIRSVSGDQTAHAPDQSVGKDDQDMAAPQSTQSPAFQFYPRDFLSSDNVDQMSMTERGVYITLISKYWLAGDLPSDLRELAGMVRMKPEKFERMWTIGKLHLCFQERGGRLIQPRLEAERRKQGEYRRRQTENGAKGGRPKKAVGNSGVTQLSPTAKPTETSVSASASAFASASSSTEKKVARALGARSGLLRGPRPEAAFDGGRVWVLHKTHADFMALRTGNQRELFDWYADVAESWNVGAHKGDEPGPNMFKFWEARYAEKWPAAPAAVSASKLPEWTRKKNFG